MSRLIDVYESVFHTVSEKTTGKARFPRPLVSADMTRCVVCQEAAKSSCGRCRSVAYCSAECQKVDWKKGHKKKCKLLAEAKAEPQKPVEQDSKSERSETDELREKLREARKRAQEKQYMHQ